MEQQDWPITGVAVVADIGRCPAGYTTVSLGSHRTSTNILNHTSNPKSDRSFNITYIVSSIVTQFSQKLKHLFIKMKGELHQSIIPF